MSITLKRCVECQNQYGFTTPEEAKADTEDRCWGCRCKLDALAGNLGIPGNRVLATHLRDLELRLVAAEAKLAAVSVSIGG